MEIDLLNISLGGISIESCKEMDKGDELFLQLKSDDTSIALNAVTVWSVRKEKLSGEGHKMSCCRAGMKFKDLFPSEFRDLVELLFSSLKNVSD
jgi:hypothetical protein